MLLNRDVEKRTKRNWNNWAESVNRLKILSKKDAESVDRTRGLHPEIFQLRDDALPTELSLLVLKLMQQ